MNVPTNVCVFCSRQDSLDAKMTVTLEDGSKAEVSICSDHADDATIRSVKAAYEAKKKQIDDVMKQMEALGIKVATERPAGIVVARSTEKSVDPRMVAEAVQPPEKEIVEEPGTKIVSTTLLDRDTRSFAGAASGSGLSMSVASYNSYQVTSNGAKDGSNLDPSVRMGQAKIAVVEGRDGVALQLPVERRDGTGTTKLTIKSSYGDRDLQDRFKRIADESRHDRGPDFRNHYDVDESRPCPVCRGRGVTQHRGRGIECPKCQGSGII